MDGRLADQAQPCRIACGAVLLERRELREVEVLFFFGCGH
jgi:hypothetical protein